MNKIAARRALADLARKYQATRRWLDWCHGLTIAMEVAGVYIPDEYPTKLAIAVESEYVASNPRPRMPSKDHKHRMYSDAYRAAQLAELNVAPGSISSMDGIANIIVQVTAAIALAA